jgi:hypothetical protein
LVVSAGENRDVVTSAMSHWSMESVCSSGIQDALSRTRLVVISPNAELDENYNEAIALGAFDMIASPSRRSDVQWIAIRAMHEDARRTASKRRPRITPPKDSEPASEEAPRISKGTATG